MTVCCTLNDTMNVNRNCVENASTYNRISKPRLQETKTNKIKNRITKNWHRPCHWFVKPVSSRLRLVSKSTGDVPFRFHVLFQLLDFI